MNVIITKTHYIPNFYQQTYPPYESMGASDRDMQRGTTLVFGKGSSKTYGSLRKGTKRRENPSLFDVQNSTFFPKTSPNTCTTPKVQRLTRRKSFSFLRY